MKNEKRGVVNVSFALRLSACIAQADMRIGTWAIGGGTWWGETDDNLSIRAIHAALDAGITMIDTAGNRLY